MRHRPNFLLALSVRDHLATALGVAAVKAGKAVHRCTLAELIEALGRAEREGRLTEKLRFYSRASLLIVDEIGYLPITSGGANLFFQLVNARYEKGAMILTSNRGFAEWGEVFATPSSPPRSSTGSCVTPSSRSRARATGSALTPISSRSTPGPTPPSCRHRHPNAAAGRRRTERWIADRLITGRRGGEFCLGTSSAPLGLDRIRRPV